MRSSLIRPVWWSTSYLFRCPLGISMTTSTSMSLQAIGGQNCCSIVPLPLTGEHVRHTPIPPAATPATAVHPSGGASASATTYGRSVSSAQMIDWELAISTGVRFARQGPNVSLAEARAVVAELRGLTAVVQQPVRDVTGLVSQGSIGPVPVVDRPGWIRANVGGFRVVLEPLADRLAERGTAVPGSGVMGAVGSRVTGVQAGLILAYLSARVLGQYELFLPPGEGT